MSPGRRLVVVDLRSGLGDRLHDGGIAGHVLRHVGNDREGRDDLELALCGVSGRCSRKDQRCEAKQQGSKLHHHLLGDRPGHYMQLQIICNKGFACYTDWLRDWADTGGWDPAFDPSPQGPLSRTKLRFFL